MLQKNLQHTKSKHVTKALLYVFGGDTKCLLLNELPKYRASPFDLLIAEAHQFEQQHHQKSKHQLSSVEYLRNMDKTPPIHSRIISPSSHRPIIENDYDENMLKRYDLYYYLTDNFIVIHYYVT